MRMNQRSLAEGKRIKKQNKFGISLGFHYLYPQKLADIGKN